MCESKANRDDAFSRRKLLVGSAAAAALLALPGCATSGRLSLTEAVRRLLLLSSERAFLRLTAPGGFWDDSVTRLGLPGLLGSRGNVLASILTSDLFKQRLEREFAHIAVRGAERAAPVVADVVRTIGVANALALINGGPTAATAFLQGELADGLIGVMVPELGDSIRLSRDPLVGEAIAALTGINVPMVAQDFAGQVDAMIWREIGREEAAIRANPRSTNDPLLIAVLGTL